MSALLDGVLAPPEREVLEGHIASCDACRREYDGLERLVSTLHALPGFPAPPGFADEILSKVEGTSTCGPRGAGTEEADREIPTLPEPADRPAHAARRRIRLRVLAAAASVILAAGIGLGILHRGQRTGLKVATAPEESREAGEPAERGETDLEFFKGTVTRPRGRTDPSILAEKGPAGPSGEDWRDRPSPSRQASRGFEGGRPGLAPRASETESKLGVWSRKEFDARELESKPDVGAALVEKKVPEDAAQIAVTPGATKAPRPEEDLVVEAPALAPPAKPAVPELDTAVRDARPEEAPALAGARHGAMRGGETSEKAAAPTSRATPSGRERFLVEEQRKREAASAAEGEIARRRVTLADKLGTTGATPAKDTEEAVESGKMDGVLAAVENLPEPGGLAAEKTELKEALDRLAGDARENKRTPEAVHTAAWGLGGDHEAFMVTVGGRPRVLALQVNGAARGDVVRILQKIGSPPAKTLELYFAYRAEEDGRKYKEDLGELDLIAGASGLGRGKEARTTRSSPARAEGKPPPREDFSMGEEPVASTIPEEARIPEITAEKRRTVAFYRYAPFDPAKRLGDVLIPMERSQLGKLQEALGSVASVHRLAPSAAHNLFPVLAEIEMARRAPPGAATAEYPRRAHFGRFAEAARERAAGITAPAEGASHAAGITAPAEGAPHAAGADPAREGAELARTSEPEKAGKGKGTDLGDLLPEDLKAPTTEGRGTRGEDDLLWVWIVLGDGRAPPSAVAGADAEEADSGAAPAAGAKAQESEAR